MTPLYLERYLNYGLTREELTAGKPIIGIAQSGSDLSPCNRHHLELAKRVRDGIRDAGGIAFEFPMHPIQETGRRPTAALDRNLAYLGLVEVLHGYPLDGVVLTTAAIRPRPPAIMAAATVNIPAIVLSGGPMLNGWWRGERAGSGSVVWWARRELAAGRMDYNKEFLDLVSSSAPSIDLLALHHRECQLTCVEGTVDRIKSIRAPHSNDLLLKPTRSVASGRRSGAGSGEDLRLSRSSAISRPPTPCTAIKSRM
jgi:hypothetical protein